VGGGVVLLSLLRVPAFIGLLLAWWLWTNRDRMKVSRKWREWLVVYGVGLLPLTFVVNNPQSTPRYFVGTILLTFAFIVLRWSRRHSFGLWIALFVFGLLVAFPYSDYFRTEFQRSFEITPVTTQLTTVGDYDAFQQVLNTLQYVSAEGVSFGWQLLGVVLFWVPRALWPGKPLGSGELVAEFQGYEFTNIDSPLWAEAYINAGIVGVILIFFAFGALTGTLQKLYLDPARSSSSLVSVLVPLLAAYQIFLIRGELISTFAYLTPLVGLVILATTRVPPPQSEETAGSPGTGETGYRSRVPRRPARSGG